MPPRLIVRTLVLAVFLALFAPALAGDAKVLEDYRRRFTKTAYLSDKEQVVRELAETGSAEGRAALLWCASLSREVVDETRKKADKAYGELSQYQQELDDHLRKWVEAEKKRGDPDPDVRRAPRPAVMEKLTAAQAAVTVLEKRIAEEREIVAKILDAHGQLVARMRDAAQQALRDEWAKGPLQSKDWAARAEQYELLGHTPTEWALHLLQDAAVKDADPRALVAALQGLGGRDATKVVPVLAERLQDARWLVRAAALEALERTPSRETIDAIVERLQVEQGRLVDDCARVLRTLTGMDIAANPDAWKRYWEANRETWTAAPPRAKEDAKPDPNKPPAPSAAAPGKTGFFGIETKSRRIVYVIDLSGSMHEKAGDKGEETRADRAKAELVQTITALEDGALFDIVLYASAVSVWRPEMTVADRESRKAAIEFVEKAPVVGATATYDALEAAFALGDAGKGKRREADPSGDAKVDTIILLSDGHPTMGRIVKPEGIRDAIRELNKTRRITIHTIAFGRDAEHKFMEGLARDAGGQYIGK